tara:strand:+ start:1946 stop:2236 length:291 start_codon:yes stop_codon:yes gene_type:complete
MKVVVSKTALKNYHQIVDYLIETWGRSVGVQFEKRTKSFLDLLTDFPEIGINVNPEKKIRAFQLTSQTRIYYRVMKDKIVILTFFDVRQNPDMLNY